MAQPLTFEEWLNQAEEGRDSPPGDFTHPPKYTPPAEGNWTEQIHATDPGAFGGSPTGGEDPLKAALPETAGSDYERIVSDYLRQLQEPVHLPERPRLTRMESAASIFDPEAARAIESRLDEPYKRKLTEYQLNMQRQGQAAGLAGNLSERQWQRANQEKKESENQEYMWANAGYAPPGYVWKNAGAKAMYEGRVGERAKKEAEFKMVHPGKKRPMDVYRENQAKRKDALGKHLDSVQGGLAAILGPGLTDPNMQKRIGDAQAEYDFLTHEEAATSGMDENMFNRYLSWPPQKRVEFTHRYWQQTHPGPKTGSMGPNP